MTNQDREWVKAMIQTACTEVLGKTWEAIDESQLRCPVVTKLRNISIGIGIGVFLAGGSAGMVIMEILK